MKKMINIRNSIIIILCVTIICMGIGFALMSMRLEKVRNNTPHFDLSFNRVVEETSIKGGKTAPTATNTISNNKKEIDMTFNLYTVRDELAYKIYIKNMGNIPAKIYALKETPDFLNSSTSKNSIYPVTITHNDIIDKVVEPNEEIELKVIVLYNSSATQQTYPSKKINYQLSLVAASP